MPPIINSSNNQLSPEDAAASLAFATNLLNQHLASQVPQDDSQDAPQDGLQNAPQNASGAQDEAQASLRDQYPQEEEKHDIEAIKEELQSLRQEIKDVLNENGQDETQQST